MKLILHSNTIAQLETGVLAIYKELDAEPKDQGPLLEQLDHIAAQNIYANRSITKIGDEYVLEVNDEILTRYFTLYLRVARFIGPLIKPLMALVQHLKQDVAEIEEFINKRNAA